MPPFLLFKILRLCKIMAGRSIGGVSLFGCAVNDISCTLQVLICVFKNPLFNFRCLETGNERFFDKMHYMKRLRKAVLRLSANESALPASGSLGGVPAMAAKQPCPRVRVDRAVFRFLIWVCNLCCVLPSIAF